MSFQPGKAAATVFLGIVALFLAAIGLSAPALGPVLERITLVLLFSGILLFVGGPIYYLVISPLQSMGKSEREEESR